MDEAAIAELYRQYAPAIYGRCRRLLGSAAEARDATHEAFARMISQAPSHLRGDDALRYLFRVSTNVCINWLRERRVHERAAPSLAARVPPASSEHEHADRQFAAALIARGDQTDATIAILHHVDGMQQTEIAELLGITRRTVFNRLRKLERLAEALLRAPANKEGAK